ncbi:MAG: FeS-binding protein [Desulfovibrio sp.]|nr:FeS-binding protein [Desulfovibrio sp.]
MTPPSLFSTPFKWIWGMAVLCAFVTGFLQHPFLLVRYGILSPVNNGIVVAHYWVASVLLCLGIYALVVWVLSGRARFRFTRIGGLRVWMLLAMGVSGMLLVLNDLPEITFYGDAYLALKIVHFWGAVLLFLLSTVHFFLRIFRGSTYLVPVKK